MSLVAWALCREMRRARGWSQRRLAEAAGTTPATIARIEKGRMEPTVAMLTRLATAAGFELKLSLAEAERNRSASEGLSLEDRLRQNDRLSRLRATPHG